jgi:hypothetical protein
MKHIQTIINSSSITHIEFCNGVIPSDRFKFLRFKSKEDRNFLEKLYFWLTGGDIPETGWYEKSWSGSFVKRVTEECMKDMGYNPNMATELAESRPYLKIMFGNDVIYHECFDNVGYLNFAKDALYEYLDTDIHAAVSFSLYKS